MQIVDVDIEPVRIYVQYPNPQYGYWFTAQGVFQTDTELFLLGFSEEDQEMTFLGIILEKKYAYKIKQKAPGYYKKALSLPIGKYYSISSDITSGIWTTEKALKVVPNPVLDWLKIHPLLKEIEKIPDGFMVPTTSFSQGMINYQKIKF